MKLATVFQTRKLINKLKTSINAFSSNFGQKKKQNQSVSTTSASIISKSSSGVFLSPKLFSCFTTLSV